MQGATRKGKRKRAMGGMLIGIRRDLIEKGKEISVKEEGVVGEVRKEAEKWRIIGVYVSKGLDVAKSSLKK